jgi:hypothetical protein
LIWFPARQFTLTKNEVSRCECNQQLGHCSVRALAGLVQRTNFRGSPRSCNRRTVEWHFYCCVPRCFQNVIPYRDWWLYQHYSKREGANWSLTRLSMSQTETYASHGQTSNTLNHLCFLCNYASYAEVLEFCVRSNLSWSIRSWFIIFQSKKSVTAIKSMVINC